MALTDRSTVRAEVAALFSGLAEFAAVYAYPATTFGNQSPVLTVHSDGTVARMLAAHNNENDHYFIVTIYVNQEAHGVADAEVLLDDCYTAVIQAIRDQVSGTSYTVITPAPDRSRPAFATIDGVAFRIEEVGIITRSNPNG